MKRFLLLLLSLILVMGVLAACDEQDPPPTPDPDGGEQVAEVIAPDDLPGTRKTSRFNYADFAGEGDNSVLRIKLPKEWTYTEESGAYQLLENGARIGTISAGAPNDAGMESAKKMTYDGIDIEVLTGKLTRDGVTEPYYQILFSYKDGTKTVKMTLEAKQSTMDAMFIKWCSQPEVLTIKGYNEIPSIPLGEGNGKTEILLLGNSFLFDRYSNLKAILQDMVNAGDKDCTVVRSGIGYATVTSYATSEDSDYPAIRNDIQAGRFSVVFLCGLYSSDDVANIEIMQELCEASGTRLVLLPAHNEGNALIEEAVEEYPDIPCLNWKDEINTLIDSGVDRTNFVVDDAHGHSTELAGYAGAHMIYRSLFGELPPDLGEDGAISQGYVEGLLGTYVDEGLRRLDTAEVNWFK